MFDKDAVYLILYKENNKVYYLYRKLTDVERPDPDIYYRDADGYRWLPIGSSTNRRKLEECVEGYRIVEKVISKIANVFKEGYEYERANNQNY